jgi:hypothetical protein
MISGKKTLRLLLTMTTLLATSGWCAEPEVAALIGKLAKPVDTKVAFTEVRFSALLREPLVVSGQLIYGGPSTLDRQVTEPYREDTEIRGESVVIQRAGQQPRKFLLQRAPELRGLLQGLSALLAGDAQAVQRDFSVVLSGTEQQWQLDLTPTDARIRRRLKLIRAQGSAAEPRCFSLLNRDDGVSIMLMGDAARPVPGQPLTRAAIESRCAGAS